jgi:hypothetical protein
MSTYPLINGINEMVGILFINDKSFMPSCAPTNHMEDRIFVYEQDVALNLLVEAIRHI